VAILVLGYGTIDDRESAFPQAAELDDGSLICAYSNAGGQFATSGTDWARSVNGIDWQVEGTLLGASVDPPSTNFLKASRSIDGSTLFAYGARSSQTGDLKFGERWSDAVFCTSVDGGRTWSDAVVIPMPTKALEISHGMLAVSSERLLAPAATIEPGRLGERVIVAISDDAGGTWPRLSTAMQDPEGLLGYLEQKLVVLPDGRVLVTAWTVTLDGLVDQPNSFALSSNGGETWSSPASMGIMGQTLSVVGLADGRLLIVYNRRYGRQGIVAALGRLEADKWTVDEETLLYDAQRAREERRHDEGVEEMLDFEFGFPTIVVRRDGTHLVTYWSVQDGRCGVRSAVVQITA